MTRAFIQVETCIRVNIQSVNYPNVTLLHEVDVIQVINGNIFAILQQLVSFQEFA